jgi:hypothetical protein
MISQSAPIFNVVNLKTTGSRPGAGSISASAPPEHDYDYADGRHEGSQYGYDKTFSSHVSIIGGTCV